MDISLNGKWAFKGDENDVGIPQKWYSLAWLTMKYADLERILVPSNFNTLPRLEKYAGAVWYFTELPVMPYRPSSHEYYVELNGSN